MNIGFLGGILWRVAIPCAVTEATGRRCQLRNWKFVARPTSSGVTNSRLPIFWPAGRAQVLQQPSGDVASLIACHRADAPMTRIRHEEQTICTLYDHKQFKCRKCGCLMSIKPWLRSAKCPDNPPRWYGTVKTGRPLARQTQTAR
jgi:hypothetical protein